MKKLISIIMILALCAAAASAQQIRFTDQPLPVEIDAPEGSDESEGIVTVDLTDFHVLALKEEKVLLWQDGVKMYATQEQLADVLDLSALPDVENVEHIDHGRKGDDVLALQQNLVTLGYLESEPDGDYGRGTRKAVEAFQNDHGIKDTGDADVLTLLLIESFANGVTEMTAERDPSRPFEIIAKDIPIDYSPLYDCKRKIEYDDLTGEGFITIGEPAVYENSAASDLNRSKCTMTFGYRLNGIAHTCIPAVIVVCEGARRPYIKSLLTKAGDARLEIPAVYTTSEATGPVSIETAIFELNSEQIAAFKDVSDIIQIRVVGELIQYDVKAEGEAVRFWGEAGEQLITVG